MSAANQKSDYGLVAGHAYTVLGPRTYNGEKLVLLRNPWGSERYTGPWSDTESPSRWTDHAKSALNHTLANDGKFFMRFTDYKNIFYRSDVNYYDTNWKASSLNTHWDRSTDVRTLVYNLKNHVSQRVVLGLSAANTRMFNKGSCVANERPERFLFYLRTKNNGTWIRDDSQKYYNFFRANGKDFFVFENLPADDYQIRFNGQVSSRTSATGNMPFTVNAWGASRHLDIN